MAKQRGWYKKDPDYMEFGAWGFNARRLQSKIVPGLTDEHCTSWSGSMSPTGALMGAWKNDYQQMIQARRLVWMMENQQDVSEYSVTLSCNNQQCCNSKHFILKPTNRPEKTL